MLSKTIKIGNLFKALNIDNNKFYTVQNVNEHILIETPNGYVPIRGYVIKNNIETVDAEINGIHIKGADKHLVKVNNEWHSLDSFKHTSLGKRNCYDVAIDEPHEYLTANGIINHNTSIAKALVNDLNAEHLYINASSDNGIDMIRDIKEFAQTMSFTGDNKQKIVILDEADGLSTDAQKALRAYIEEYPDSCRFIFTCNYASKIIPALHEGRTMEFEFDMSKPEYVIEMKQQIRKRLEGILKFEKIPFDESIMDKFIDVHYPSIRKMIAVLQKYSMMKGEIDADIVYYKDVGEELAKLIMEKKLTDARKYINEHGLSYSDVFKYMFDEVVPKLKNKGQAILYIADYEYKCSFSSDPSIQIAACMVDLFSCL